VVIAYDDGEPVKMNRTTVEITVLQPSRIPIFTEEEYRWVPLSVESKGTDVYLFMTCSL